MKRAFDFKEAKNLIKDYQSMMSSLMFGSAISNIFKERTIKTFSDIQSKGIFSRIARREMLGEISQDPIPQFDQILKQLCRYSRSIDIASRCSVLRDEIEEPVVKNIRSFEKADNSLKWAFSSEITRQSVSDAYAFLGQFMSSQEIIEAKRAIADYQALDSTSVDEARNEFFYDHGYYEELIRNLIPAREHEEYLDIIRYVFEGYKGTENAVKELESLEEQQRLGIRQALEPIIRNGCMELLKDTPIEELNREKTGIRTKTLRDAGYERIVDVYNASEKQLEEIKGISKDNAMTIKKMASEYVMQARNNVRIKLSYDDRNRDSEEIVRRIADYRPKFAIYKELQRQIEFNADPSEQAKRTLKHVGNGRFWPFFSDEVKESAKDAYAYLKDLAEGDYRKQITEGIRQYRKAGNKNTADAAWLDFRDNSIEYYNILEDICPGILGSGDSLYGLPEDLAKEIQNECFFPDGLICTLRRYQEWGVKYILHQGRVLLGDEMGLGKTVQAIATMVSLKNVGATHFVVVCPASVLTNWCREIEKHSKLTAIKAHGDKKFEALRQWMEHGGVIVSSYESNVIFNDLPEDFKFSQLVVDEAHYVKNLRAARTKRTRKLAEHAERILLMTGTALENKVDEMISLIDILDPKLAEEIKNKAFLASAPQFREMVAPVYYRRRREDVLTELPDLIESEEWCTLSPEEEQIYEASILGRRYSDARRVSWNVPNIEDSTKMKRLTEIVAEAKSDDRRILIFSFFLDTLRKISNFYGPRCIGPITGAVDPAKRQDMVDEFKKSEAGTVLTAQIQAGGTGLNIQAASVVIICEPQLKPSAETQAIGRAYRMGQSRSVLVYRLLGDETLDERMLEILRAKQEQFDAFADKSVAAENVEIDDATLSNLIEKEIVRIQEKNAATTPVAS